LFTGALRKFGRKFGAVEKMSASVKRSKEFAHDGDHSQVGEDVEKHVTVVLPPTLTRGLAEGIPEWKDERAYGTPSSFVMPLAEDSDPYLASRKILDIKRVYTQMLHQGVPAEEAAKTMDELIEKHAILRHQTFRPPRASQKPDVESTAAFGRMLREECAAPPFSQPDFPAPEETLDAIRAEWVDESQHE